MIDGEKIRAEIEKLLKEWRWYSSTEAKFRCETYKELLEFIGNLPEEPVSEDLKEAARDYVFKEHKSPLSMIIHQADLKAETQYINDCESCFIAGAKWDRGKTL